MAKRSPDERLLPPPPPRARGAMVTIDLDSHAAALDSETIAVHPARQANEPPLPFRSASGRPSEPPPSAVAPQPAPSAEVTPAATPRSVAPPANALAPAPMPARTILGGPGASPWLGARLRPSDAPLPPTSTEVAPPALLSVEAPATGRAAQPGRRVDSTIASGPLQGQILDWIGCRNERASRVREVWAELLAEPEAGSMADQLRAAFEPGPPSPSQARKWCHRVLAAGSCDDLAGLKRQLRSAATAAVEGEPPLRLVTGELRFTFDELETLRATVAAVAPHLEDDEALAKAVVPAKRMLEDRSLQGSRDAASDLVSRLRLACQESAVVEDPVVLRRVERTLVEARAFSYRNLLGAKWARALLVREGVSVTCYVPEAIAAILPLYASFPARVIGEIFPRQDHDEESAVAIVVVALGRLIEKGDD
ncbi:MAG: hypothetical protein FJ096_02760 [Deltaproteobacteria bacterium]|nr:hypothetical protein [Deltaproteobacteria bacterium]